MAPRKVDPALLAEQRLAENLGALDFATVLTAAVERPQAQARGGACRICAGRFGPVLDVSQLVRGASFVTADGVVDDALVLRQVSSTHHGDDFDTLPPMDAITLVESLARVDAFLSACGDERWPAHADGRRGHVAIAKRRHDRRHGSQLVTFHPREPRWLLRERAFVARHGVGYASWMETRSDETLLVGEFRGGLVAAVPPVPRRAFEVVIWFRPGATGSLADLSGNQRWGLAQAVREITGALRLELAVRGLPESYGWRLVAGPGLEPHLRIVTPRETVVADGPTDWVERLRSHIGVE